MESGMIPPKGKASPPCVHRLRDMIGSPDVAAEHPDGVWVRAVPLPWGCGIGDKIVAAWWVITGRAYAVEWPEPGDLEIALGAPRSTRQHWLNERPLQKGQQSAGWMS